MESKNYDVAKVAEKNIDLMNQIIENTNKCIYLTKEDPVFVNLDMIITYINKKIMN